MGEMMSSAAAFGRARSLAKGCSSPNPPQCSVMNTIHNRENIFHSSC